MRALFYINRFLIATLVLCLGSLLLQSSALAEDEQAKPAAYYTLYPNFITHLNSQAGKSFAEVRVELMVDDASQVEIIKYYEPLLRDKLIELFTQQSRETMRAFAQRKALQETALKELQKLMQHETGKPTIKRVLFTKVLVE